MMSWTTARTRRQGASQISRRQGPQRYREGSSSGALEEGLDI